jgi:3,4-dihydroxy 2-butanone 4-phosphate synthase/GTP cyclohydrolase II
MTMVIAPIEEILEEIRAGRLIILLDDEGPDSAGFFCAAAEKVTTETVNFMLRHGRGQIYLGLSEERMRALGIPLMIQESSSGAEILVGALIALRSEAQTSASAPARAKTIRAAVAPETVGSDFVIPGSVLPVQARNGGVLMRSGQVEAALDLSRLAGLEPGGVICQMLRDDGAIALTADVEEAAARHGVKIASIAELISYRLREETLVERTATSDFPTIHGGVYRAFVYRNRIDGRQHIALVKGEIAGGEGILVRLHSECLTGDVFGSERCDCGDQIRRSLKMIDEEGRGILVYMHQEGRGIGLTNKIKAYALQDQGLDTVEANLELGFKEDLRDYGVGALVLRDLGVKKLRLLTNNPRKIIGLEGYGLVVVERVPLEIPPHQANIGYLRTKQKKLGHLLSNLR